MELIEKLLELKSYVKELEVEIHSTEKAKYSYLVGKRVKITNKGWNTGIVENIRPEITYRGELITWVYVKNGRIGKYVKVSEIEMIDEIEYNRFKSLHDGINRKKMNIEFI